MPRNTKCAFTLVELLVVIGIIALLISILLPALNRAQQAEIAKCLSNLRQIGTAITNYATDNHFYLVPGRYDASTYPASTSVAELESWATILVNGRYLPTPPQAPSLNTAWADTSFGDSVFRCPAGINVRGDLNGMASPKTPIDPLGAVFTRLQSNSSQTRVDTWYGINGWTATPSSSEVSAFARWPFTDIPYPGTGLDQNLHKVTDFASNSELVLVFDGYYWANQDAENVNCRHKGWSQANLLMADGHAQSIALTDLTGGVGKNSIVASLYNPAGTNGYSTGVGANLKSYHSGFRFILTPYGP